MDKNKVLEQCHKALAMEYADVFLYQRHVNYFNNFPGVCDLFKNFSQMESRHADSFARAIMKLGGTPVYNVLMPPAKKTQREILEFHLNNEHHAVEMYAALAEMIDDPDLKNTVDQIRIEESIHEAALMKLLNVKWG